MNTYAQPLTLTMSIPHISKCVNEECAFSTFDAKRALHALYKMDNAACGRTAFAFGAYTMTANDGEEYWRPAPCKNPFQLRFM